MTKFEIEAEVNAALDRVREAVMKANRWSVYRSKAVLLKTVLRAIEDARDVSLNRKSS